MPIRARQRKLAVRVGESREPACRRAFVQLACVLTTNEKPKYARPTKLINRSQTSFLGGGVMREGSAFIAHLSTNIHCSFSSSFLCICACMRRLDCFPGAWRSWHLQVVSLRIQSWTSMPVLFACCSVAASAARGAKRLIYHTYCTRYLLIVPFIAGIACFGAVCSWLMALAWRAEENITLQLQHHIPTTAAHQPASVWPS